MGDEQTRRPRQKSKKRSPSRVPGSISATIPGGCDFCRARQTKPISWGVRKWARAGAGRLPSPSSVEQTNPIGQGHTHCSSIPSFQSIPIVRNKPNRAYTAQWTSTWSKRSYDESAQALSRQTKPIASRRLGRQGVRIHWLGESCQTKPIGRPGATDRDAPSFHYSTVPFSSLSRQTKPIGPESERLRTDSPLKSQAPGRYTGG